MRLLEREPQLLALRQYAAEARAGQGRLVLVAGEAGVGKSSLLDQLEQELDDARSCWGACDGLFTPRPLGPLFDVAARLGGGLQDLCRSGAPREELFGALLDQLRGDELTVLVVEDVHWADEATLDLVRFLGRRIRDVRALLVVTYRDDGLVAGDPLRVALGELASQRATRRLDLPRLSADAVHALTADTGVDGDDVYRLTGGNPFFVSEVMQAEPGQLPGTARDAVLARVARLSGSAREVLDTAALIGSRVEPAFLETVTGAAPDLVDELLSCGVLTGEGGLLRFRHEIARVAIESGVPAHRRTHACRAILRALLAAGCDDPERLAFYADAIGAEALVLEHAPRAGRRASELAAHREAAVQYERALRFASAADIRTVAALYDDLASELALVDRWQDSADAREAALLRWREVGDRVREGDCLRLLSRTMWRLCRGEDSRRAAEAALEVLEPLGPSRELAWAYAGLAGVRTTTDRAAEAVELSGHAQRLAASLGLGDVLSDALNTEGCARQATGGDGAGPLRRALDVALENGHDEQAGRAYANLHASYCGRLLLAEAEPWYVAGIAYCDEHDISTFGTCLRGERASSLEKLGRWAEAAELCVQLLERAGASPVNRLNPLIALGKIRARQGDPAAWKYLDEARDAADGVAEPAWIGAARLARAEAWWLEGAAHRASEEIERASRVVGRPDSVLFGAVAVWRDRLGLLPVPGPAVAPFASEVAGQHRQAAAQWSDLGYPYEAALTLLHGTDEADLREALARFEALGAVAAARLARQRMRAVGVRKVPAGARPSTRANPAGLTVREAEVLELLCDGHTDAEISERLFISVKTVNHHVSSVLGKLRVPTRQVAAGEARRRGLIGLS